jgi:hypothetical protein
VTLLGDPNYILRMALTVGVVLALGVGLMCTAAGMDRDRALYPAVMIVIAALYSLFAIMGGSMQALVLDMLVGSVFVIAALVGFKSSLWIVAVALAAHGILDSVHNRLIANPGVPGFWPPFCMAYDVAAAAYLAWLLKAGRIRATA